jgi:hypothetical protein
MSNAQMAGMQVPQYTRFGRPLPQPGVNQQGPQVPHQTNPGMFVPHQSLVNNAAMLGMRNPIQSLGFGQYNIPQLNPAAIAQKAASPTTVPTAPAYTTPLNWLGQPIDNQPQG